MTAPTPAELSQAQADGRRAHDDGQPSAACPHEPREPLGLRWLRGYLDARAEADYGTTR